MAGGVSNLEVRMNITNYNTHPENPNYTVFHFYREDMSEHFKSLLVKSEIPFEYAEEEGERTLYLYGISNSYYSKSVRLNFETIGKYRERFIPNTVFAVTLIIVVILLVLFAFIGYLKS